MSRQGLDIQLRHNLHKSSIIFINSFILVLSAFLVRHAIICKNIERDVKCSHPSYKVLIILECTVLLNLVMILAKRGIFEVFFDDNKFFFIVKRLPMGFLVFANLRINLTEPRKDLGFIARAVEGKGRPVENSWPLRTNIGYWLLLPKLFFEFLDTLTKCLLTSSIQSAC